MRVLEFPRPEIYDILFEALLSASSKGDDSKKLSKAIKAMKKVGTPKSLDGRDSRLYTLSTSEPVHLEDSWYEVVKRKVAEVEWNGIGVELGGEMMEWLDDVPTIEKWQARKDGVLKLEKNKKEPDSVAEPAD